MMLLKTKGIIWSYIGLIWPYWKSLELNYFTNIYLNECISIVLLSLLEKRTVNRSFSFRNPKESWISSFVMIVEISTEHRALNHIPFIYLIFLDGGPQGLSQGDFQFAWTQRSQRKYIETCLQRWIVDQNVLYYITYGSYSMNLSSFNH